MDEGTLEVVEAAQRIAREMIRPSVLFRPTVSLDGNEYCCLYGSNLQEGIAAFGKTPDEATRNFDNVWWKGEIA